MSRARQVANFDPALFAADEVSGDKVSGGTIGAGTIGGSTIVNTSGAITTTGAFTSVGIDDNASGATAITIDSSENVGIGTTSPTNTLDVGGDIGLLGADADTSCSLRFYDDGGLEWTAQYDAGSLKFSESGVATRATFKDGGFVGIGTTPTYFFHTLATTGVADGWSVLLQNQYTSGSQMSMLMCHKGGYGISMENDTAAPNNTSIYFLQGKDNAASRIKIYSDGSLQNVNGTYGDALSDERLKTSITDANSQWNDVKNINIVNYKKLTEGGVNDFSRLGVIAQQVLNVSPKLIGERPPDKAEIKANPLFGSLYEKGDEIPAGEKIGDVKEEKENVLFFKDSIFFWKCAKALQEAMAKIETLEAKVTALENA